MTSRENGAPQESKKVVLEVLDIITEKLLGASRGPERLSRTIVIRNTSTPKLLGKRWLVLWRKGESVEA